MRKGVPLQIDFEHFITCEYPIRVWKPAVEIAQNGRTAALGRHVKFPDLHEVRGLEALVADIFVDVRKDMKIY